MLNFSTSENLLRKYADVEVDYAEHDDKLILSD
jgi:hypothetical protein